MTICYSQLRAVFAQRGRVGSAGLVVRHAIAAAGFKRSGRIISSFTCVSVLYSADERAGAFT